MCVYIAADEDGSFWWPLKIPSSPELSAVPPQEEAMRAQAAPAPGPPPGPTPPQLTSGALPDWQGPPED
eukprot:15471678-Alexandrium_andersonii.AAC.1